MGTLRTYQGGIRPDFNAVRKLLNLAPTPLQGSIAGEPRGQVEVREESGRIIIEPAQCRKYDLGELVKGITRENLHDEADFGKPVGKEAL